jgi:integrase
VTPRTDNPARWIELPAHRRPHAVVWTRARVAAWQAGGPRPTVGVWTAADTARFPAAIEHDELRPMLYLVAMRGLRCGEAAGLCWPDLDLDEATLTISRTLQEHVGRPVLLPPKTAASACTLALDRQHRCSPCRTPRPPARGSRRSLARRIRLRSAREPVTPSRWRKKRPSATSACAPIGRVATSYHVRGSRPRHRVPRRPRVASERTGLANPVRLARLEEELCATQAAEVPYRAPVLGRQPSGRCPGPSTDESAAVAASENGERYGQSQRLLLKQIS